MTTLEKGSRNNRFRLYEDGYVLGSSNKEPAYATALLTANITFGGFDPSYEIGTEGLIVILQDPTGGHEIDWDGKLTFVGTSGIGLAADAITVIDVLKTDIGWVGFIRSPGTSVVQSINTLTGVVTLSATGIPFANTGGKYAVGVDTVDKALLEAVNRIIAVETTSYVATSSTPFALLQAHRNKTIRQTYSSGDSTVVVSRPNFDPPNLPAGSEFFLANLGTGKMTVSPAVDVVINGAPLVIASGKFALLKYVSDNGTEMTFDIFNFGSVDEWQLKTSAYLAVKGDKLLCDTSAGSFAVTLPLAPTDGSTISFADAKGSFDVKPLTVNRNSEKIQHVSENMTVDTRSASFSLVFNSTLDSWVIV